MDSTLTLPTRQPDPSTAWQRDMLRNLANMAYTLADETHQQALRQARADRPHPDTTPATPTQTAAGLLFTRLARAIRQIIALDAHLAAGPAAPASNAEHRHAMAERRRKRGAKRQIRHRFADALEADPNPHDHENLLRTLDERIEDDDIDAAIDEYSINEIVERLCAELHVRPCYRQWTDAELGMSPDDRGPRTTYPP